MASSRAKVFISWSKSSSKAVALLLRDWLPKVLQSVAPFVSAQDIEGGQRWLQVLTEELETTNFGIVVATKENLKEPWIQFEAGALSKLPSSRVIPLLCGIGTMDIADNPLTAFQAMVCDRDGMWNVVQALNGGLTEPLDAEIVKQSFEMWWPKFDEAYQRIKFSSDAGKEQEPTQDERLARIEKAIIAMQTDVRSIAIETAPSTVFGLTLNNPGGAFNRLALAGRREFKLGRAFGGDAVVGDAYAHDETPFAEGLRQMMEQVDETPGDKPEQDQ